MVPDIPAFAVDEGFAYRVPPELAEQVEVGSLVRVPLAGRRVRGYVIGLEEAAGEGRGGGKLRDVRSLAAPVPVFTPAMLPSLRWAARHYAAPLAAVLAKTGPPNLPKKAPLADLPAVPPASGPVPEASEAAAAGGPGRTVQLVAGEGWAELIRGAAAAPVRAERSVLAVLPSAVEAAALAERLEADYGNRVAAAADQDAAALTAAWSRAAAQGGLVVVGTLRAGWWPVKDLSMIVLVEDGRPGMKERQTPTVAVRSLAAKRSAAERLQLVLVGRVPAVQTLHEGTDVVRVPGRLWAPVEVVDRSEAPPGEGVVTGRVRTAVAGVRRRGGRVFAFTHRRGYAPASRCTQCRLLRTCPVCEGRVGHSGPSAGGDPSGREAVCRRCEVRPGACSSCGGVRFEPLGAGVGRIVEELGRVVGGDAAEAGSGAPVMVGTERDLPGLPPVDLAVVVDADGLVRGTNYRAAEDALSVMARTAAAVRRERGCRMMVQTADPRHPIYAALRRGDPFPFLEEELDARRRYALPPCGEVLVLEVKGGFDPEAFDPVFEDAHVYGPAHEAGRTRWMIHADDLREVKDRLRPAVGLLRDKGCQVRVDVDPRQF